MKKEKFEKDLSDLLREFLDNQSRSSVSEKKFYIGRVVDNNDPEKLGRCRVRIFGVFDDGKIPDSDIPWALHDESFTGSNTGSFIVPPIDTIVRVYFENDNIYQPIYTSKVVDKNNISTFKDEDYPNSIVFYDVDGTSLVYNRTTFEWSFIHVSGLSFTIDKDGNVLVDNEGSKSGNIEIKAKGNVTLSSLNGNVILHAPKGNVKLHKQATAPVNNIPIDQVSGSPNNIGGQFPGTPGSTLVRP